MNKFLLKVTLHFADVQKALLSALFFMSYLLISHASADNNSQDLRQLLQLTEYIGVDYASAVLDGEVVEQGEFEEMLEFSTIIAEKSTILFSDDRAVVALAQSLKVAVVAKQPVEAIQMLTTQIKKQLLENSPQLSLPKALLSTHAVTLLFDSNCASCHGVSGGGDGELARHLVPTPTNFNDQQRADNRSILGLYDVISGGLEGTAMPSFSQLTSEQRWSLAFYTGSLAFPQDATQNQIAGVDDTSHVITLQDIVMYSPNELNVNKLKELGNVIQRLRGNPNRLFVQSTSPLIIAKAQLQEALLAYQQGLFSDAKRLAVSAYLDGFELVENNLDGFDSKLRKDIESKLLNLRQLLNDQSNAAQVDQSVTEILLLLDQAEQLLTHASMSDATLFSASFIILLREGLEALLVVIALFTILLRANKKEAIKFVHFGWVGALMAGFFTWIAAEYLVEISGASREIMEGVAAMLAAVVLFYVGFWMHSKTKANEWQRYIQKNIARSLKRGTLWGIASLAFIAVYREVFETVLFYQSLLTQTADTQKLVLLSGFGLAVIVLMLISWLMIKFSVKLPISRFFSTTTVLLLALSFILAGKAILALQEASVIAITSFPVSFQVDWLGINSTWQGVGLQLVILLLSMGLFLKSWLKTKLSWQSDLSAE